MKQTIKPAKRVLVTMLITAAVATSGMGAIPEVLAAQSITDGQGATTIVAPMFLKDIRQFRDNSAATNTGNKSIQKQSIVGPAMTVGGSLRSINSHAAASQRKLTTPGLVNFLQSKK